MQKFLNFVGKSPFLSFVENVKNIGIKALLYYFFSLFLSTHALFFLSMICGYMILEVFWMVNGAKKRNEKSSFLKTSLYTEYTWLLDLISLALGEVS